MLILRILLIFYDFLLIMFYLIPLFYFSCIYELIGTTSIYAELPKSVEVEYQHLVEIFVICFRMVEFQQLDRKSRVCCKGSQKCEQQKISVLQLLLFIIKYIFLQMSIYSMHFFSYIHTICTTLNFSNIFTFVVETMFFLIFRMHVKKLYVRSTQQTYQVFGKSYANF